MTAPSTPRLSSNPVESSRSQLQKFRFPADMASVRANGATAAVIDENPIVNLPPPAEEAAADLPGVVPGQEAARVLTKALSGSSVNGATPRSSGEFFSLSNNSTDTLVSEYIPQLQQRSRIKPTVLRREPSPQASITGLQPESLMMGYAQLTGTFTLDGSLVNQAPFEEVKRKGVVSGQGGGGVVGIATKPNAGLFGAFGWSQFGESLGGLLRGGELSSLKEMRGVANSKAIPLLRTPQSLLFVDLQLAPGESKTFSYHFPLPKGLPPSHRGRAIRISYRLVIGTQRAATVNKSQQVAQVEIPFRVFGGVDGALWPYL